MKEIKKEGNFDTFIVSKSKIFTEKYSWRPVDEMGELSPLITRVTQV